MQVSSEVSLTYQGSHLTSSEVNSFDQSHSEPTYEHKLQCNEKDLIAALHGLFPDIVLMSK